MDKELQVTLTQTRDQQPLIVFHNFPGNDTELTPAEARALADVLNLIAAEAIKAFSDNHIIKRCYTVNTETSPANKNQLLKKIDDLHLSVRAKNCLRNTNIETVQELIQKSEADLLRIRLCGRKTVKEIKAAVADLELKLRHN